MQTVWNLYAKFLENPNTCVTLDVVDKENFMVHNYDDDKTKKNLCHVEINLKTCHPYVTCPVTGQYWKDCVGEFNIKKIFLY